MAAEIAPKEIEQKALVARVREGSLAMQFKDGGLQLRNLEDAIAFGKQMIDSGFAPKGVTKASSVVWIVQRGAELGISPISALDSFYVGPSGKPELYAKAALGACIAKGILEPEYDLDTEGTGDALTAIFTFKRKGWSKAKTRRFAFTEAKTAQLVKEGSNWTKWPARMVQARVVAFALKDYFNDVLMGCSIEGDHDEPLKAEITELSRESLRPAAPDPLLAQLDEDSAAGATWDEVLDQPKVEPDDSQAATTEQDRSFLEGGNELYSEPVQAALPARPMASKADQDYLYSLSRTRGMTDISLMALLGNHGYERIDQVPADKMPELMAAVKAIRPGKR